MKGIYLGAYKANHPNYNIDYQDINGKRDIGGDMLQLNLKGYDFIIATPPCNYYSKARGSKKPGQYSFNTMHLLPSIIDKLVEMKKPFIVENVRNAPLFEKMGLFKFNCKIFFHGRHTYWTNIDFNFEDIEQGFDYAFGGVKLVENGQGGDNVHRVIERFLEVIHK